MDEGRAQCVRVCVNYVTAGNQMFIRHQHLKNCSHFTRLVLFALAIWSGKLWIGELQT